MNAISRTAALGLQDQWLIAVELFAELRRQSLVEGEFMCNSVEISYNNLNLQCQEWHGMHWNMTAMVLIPQVVLGMSKKSAFFFFKLYTICKEKIWRREDDDDNIVMQSTLSPSWKWNMVMLETSSSRDPLSTSIIVRRVLQPALAVMFGWMIFAKHIFFQQIPEIIYLTSGNWRRVTHSFTVDLRQVEQHL